MADETDANYSNAHWEAMKLDGWTFNHDVSLVHGWSMSPVFLMPRYLAGLYPLEPGWKKFAVEPVLAGLELIECSLQIPSGHIAVILHMDEMAGVGELSLSVPLAALTLVKPPSGWCIEGMSPS